MFDNQTAGIKIMENIVKTGLKIPYSSSPDYKSGLTGGKAVYKARALLRMADNNLHWTDAIICGGSPKVLSIKDNSVSKFFIYPNPSSGKISIQYHITSGSDCKISLKNILSNELKQVHLDCSGTYIECTLESFSAGLYLISFINNDHEQIIGKITLIK